jgi:hypothetical protein
MCRLWHPDGRPRNIARPLVAIEGLRIDNRRSPTWASAISNRRPPDRAALDVMLDGNLTDLMRVRRYLEQRARRLVARI